MKAFGGRCQPYTAKLVGAESSPIEVTDEQIALIAVGGDCNLECVVAAVSFEADHDKKRSSFMGHGRFVLLHVLVVSFVAVSARAELAGDVDTAVPVAAKTRLPIPSEAAQKESNALVQDVYRADYDKAKSPALKLELAKKLLHDGNRTVGDIPGKYVLLRNARDLAVLSTDVPTTLETIDAIAQTFQIDSAEMKLQALTRVAKSVLNSASQKQLVESLGALTDKSIGADNFPLAKQFSEMAIVASRKTNDATLIKESLARNKEVDRLEDLYIDVKKAERKLETAPKDAAANLMVGKYRCFDKGDWDGGLRLLAVGDDSVLQELAKTELNSPESSADRLTLADGWWSVAEKENGTVKTHIQSRSAYWYTQALPDLAGLPKAKAEKRLGQINASIKQPQPKENPVKSQLAPRINLLKLIDVARDAEPDHSDQWRLDRNGLAVDSLDRYSYLKIPYSPPKEYDLTMVFSTQRQESVNDTHVVVPIDGKGYDFVVRRTPNVPTILSFREDAESEPHLGHSPFGAKCVVQTDKIALTFKVRTEGVRAELAGTEIIAIKDLSLLKAQAPTIYLGAWHNKLIFHSIEVTPVSK